MRLIPLTQGYHALISDEDYERVSAHKWCADVVRRKDGSVLDVYAQSRSFGDGKKRKLHRFLLGVTNPHIEVDHCDGNGLNCQRNNIRACTKRQNSCNRRKPNSQHRAG